MFEMTEEEFNYCEEMEKRNQEADRKEMEEETMREKREFGKRTDSHTKKEKEDVNLGAVFWITNKGVRSKQIDTFIKRTTGIEHFKGEVKGGLK